MQISLVSTNLNSRDYLLNMLQSIGPDVDSGLISEVLILALGDENLDFLKGAPKTKVITGKLPSSFAKSFNTLVRRSKGDIVLIVNADVVIKPGAIKALVEALDDYDIVGARLMYPLKDDRSDTNQTLLGTIQHAGITWEGKYPSTASLPYHIGYGEKATKKYLKTNPAKAVCGAAMMMKRETWDKLGGLDECFRNCYEDVDICIRATDLGMKVGYVGSAEITHFVSGTGGPIRTSAEFKEEAEEYLVKKYKEGPKGERVVFGTPEGKKGKNMIPLRQIMQNSNDPGYVNRILVASPSTGNVRMEWVLARYGQAIPMNWSMVQFNQFMSSFVPLKYSVPDAQNIIVQEAINGGYQWLLLIEDDTMPPPDAFIRFNKYMRDGSVPVVSGVYFSRSIPSEPMVFRGRGNSVYWDWKFGDKVWCDGVPTGMLLINMTLMKAIYDESPQYNVGGSGLIARKVFEVPTKVWVTPEGHFNTLAGTSDLTWCTRIIEGNYFEKAGWPEIQKKKHPFLVDTSIFCKHIDRHTGVQFPPEDVLKRHN